MEEYIDSGDIGFLPKFKTLWKQLTNKEKIIKFEKVNRWWFGYNIH